MISSSAKKNPDSIFDIWVNEQKKRKKLNNIFSEFLSDKLKEIGLENLPEKYKEIAKKKILTKDEIILGKVKYNDKILKYENEKSICIFEDLLKKLKQDYIVVLMNLKFVEKSSGKSEEQTNEEKSINQINKKVKRNNASKLLTLPVAKGLLLVL